MESIIFDIDGTLADITHRRHFVMNENKDWKSFNSACIYDTPNLPLIKLLNSLHDRYCIILVSGRHEEMREQTQKWLLDNHVKYEYLYMRNSKDFRGDEIIKSEIYDIILKKGFKPICVFDDRNKVVKMWREKKILCCQVAEGDF